MTDSGQTGLSRRARRVGVAIAVTVVAIFAAANAHLVYVSLASQPDCVPHLKSPDGSGASFRAAKPAC